MINLLKFIIHQHSTQDIDKAHLTANIVVSNTMALKYKNCSLKITDSTNENKASSREH